MAYVGLHSHITITQVEGRSPTINVVNTLSGAVAARFIVESPAEADSKLARAKQFVDTYVPPVADAEFDEEAAKLLKTTLDALLAGQL